MATQNISADPIWSPGHHFTTDSKTLCLSGYNIVQEPTTLKSPWSAMENFISSSGYVSNMGWWGGVGG